MHHVGLEFVERKVSGGGNRSTNAALSLTSMIDFLVVTVVFLLMTFSASGETPVAKGLNLPKAENTLDMIDAPMVAVVGSEVLVDGSPAGNTRAIEESDRMQRIDELFNILKAKRSSGSRPTRTRTFPVWSCSRSIRTSKPSS
jgi:biopolymer transport protein ExbD